MSFLTSYYNQADLAQLERYISEDRHIIIVGNSASGKDTLLQVLCLNYKIKPLVSTTTRPMRDGEVEGVDYHFVDALTFNNSNMIDRRSYLTVGASERWHYGFDAKSALESRVSVLDLAGAMNLIQFYVLKGMPSPQIVYLDVPKEVCLQRYIDRGGDALEFERRFKADYNWQQEAKEKASLVLKEKNTMNDLRKPKITKRIKNKLSTYLLFLDGFISDLLVSVRNKLIDLPGLILLLTLAYLWFLLNLISKSKPSQDLFIILLAMNIIFALFGCVIPLKRAVLYVVLYMIFVLPTLAFDPILGTLVHALTVYFLLEDA